MNLSRYTAPLSTATLLLTFALVPLLNHAQVTTCPEESETGSSSCEAETNSDVTATSTGATASTTPPAQDNTSTSTASSTPSTGTGTSTATTSNDGTETQDETKNSGGNNSSSDNTEKVRISIRNTSVVVVSDVSFTPNETVSITPTDGNPAVEVDSASVLALLVLLDENSNKIEITDLQYYPSFGSFFLNCIEVNGENLCGSWQYTVNGNYPSVGLDQYLLDDSDSVFLFFGSPRIVEVPREVTLNAEFTATALQYDPVDDKYTPLSGYTIGIVQDDPDNPWSPKEILTKKVGSDGKAAFTLDTLGEYNVGLQDDYYYPTTPLKVIEPAHSTGGGGGSFESNTSTNEQTFDTVAARSYIVSKQNTDGSFGAPLYSDWAAIALATGGNDEPLNKVRAYLKNADGTSTHVTDHERRAMALMTLSISPYDGTATNHIEAIVAAFDDTQIGEQSEINDDIFGLLVLLAAGYDESDEVVTKLVSHITSAQNANGSWGATVDMTSAAIQALAPLKNDASITARAKARAYLKAQQKDDGGFGNSFSTSWALMAIAALNETPENWRKSGLSPLDYLASVQQDDGGLEDSSAPENNRLWATSYAVPAALGHSWLDIMQNFAKPSVLGVTTDDSTESTTTAANNPTAQQNTSQQHTDSQNTNTSFRFLSDQDTVTSAATEEIDSTKDLPDNDETTSPSTTEKKSNSDSFFSRFFSKIGSIIFFWK